MSRVHLPPGWAKFWWFADCIQYDNQPEPQKKHPRFFSERIHAPADSFISENEGMNERPTSNGPMPANSEAVCHPEPLDYADIAPLQSPV